MKPKKNPELEIGRHSSIYFAIGLNLMLLLSWRALEHRTYQKDDFVMEVLDVNYKIEDDIPIVKMNTPAPPPPPAKVPQIIEVIEDDIVDIEETVIESTETGQDDAIEDFVAIGVDEVVVEEVEEDVEVAFAVIEEVPVFPGCEGLSKEKTKACFQQKVQEHVVKNFNYPDVALQLGIQGRVSVVFVIDSQGKTTKIRSRGPDKLLEKEAERIISIMPKMEPGKQRGKPVTVQYAVPIYFKYAATH
ncbi:energy transducer TonB [Tamlana nanhaiensis]|uniref:Energy transducer TonB n=1 Tax=Neotamlana nanhaiensis TaxID=1382798 RepID=A0A0D7VZF0_9FLAO|nr:energy transducer TonB [Tamlana nanhaiensis]KJD32078.1 energy transducer TonB [Tamlana nanhaiensis]KJD32240.1 energy transducer TonB [Tamlana nanhaiensis]